MPTDPAHLTPEQRRREIAAILAKGVLRLRSVAQIRPGSAPESRSPKKGTETLRKALELSATSSPHATTG